MRTVTGTWIRAAAIAGLLCATTSAARAEVKPLAYYRLGEADKGAAAGKPTIQTNDESGGPALLKPPTPVGQPGPKYEAVTQSPASSTLCLHFDGNSCLRRTGLIVPGNDNYGLEAFVKPDQTGLTQYIVSWGDGTRGLALVRAADGGYQALIGGATLIGNTGPQPAGIWAHVAVVRTGGKTTFYFNGKAMGETAARVNTAGRIDGFVVGASGDTKDGLFQGCVDEVRVFTFEKGKFEAGDLLCKSRP